MPFLFFLELFNSALVLFFGLFLSVFIAGGWQNSSQRRLVFLLCPFFLLIQGIFWLFLGTDSVTKLYPLIIHLPLVLLLIFALKKPFLVSLVSVLTAYLCCQLPRWVSLTVTFFTDLPLAGECCYTLSIFPIFFFLYRYLARTAHDVITFSPQTLFLFGSLPFAYYLFDYATTVYSNLQQLGHTFLNEFLPTLLIIFYLLLLSAYHRQVQKRTQAELQKTVLENELQQAATEMENLRRSEAQTAIYHHDIRHHLTMIESFLSAGKPQQAEEYIQKVQTDLRNIVPKRFCKNETVNLLYSAFFDRAQSQNITLKTEIKLPPTLPFSDTELCSLLSNALENAIHAVTPLSPVQKWISFYCVIRWNKLLIEVKNPFSGEILLHDGLPVSSLEGHGYGCRSIRTIAERFHGICSFEPENGIFTLRIILPIPEKSSSD